MTSESAATSPATPPPQYQHSDHNTLPQNQLSSKTIPSPSQATMHPVANSNGVLLSHQFIDEIEEPSYFKYLDSNEYAVKYQSYESDFKHMILAKYLSGTDPNGVNIYEERTIFEGETIMSSKWPCTRFYADPDISFAKPVQCLEEEEDVDEGAGEEENVDPASAEISPGQIPNGGIVLAKNGY
ncbi:unnamed protein product [Cochlearia groenlandica]